MTERELRVAVATRIAALDAATWRESAGAPDLVGRLPATAMHGAYSVDVPSSRVTRGTQRRSMLVEARVLVRFLWRLKPSEGLVSTDAALDAEVALVDHLCAQWGPVHLLWQDSQRASLDSGDWRLHILTFVSSFYATPS